MTTQFKRPDVAGVKATAKEQLATVQAETEVVIAAAQQEYAEASAQVEGAAQEKLDATKGKFDTSVAASRQTVADQAAEVARLEALLRAAKTQLTEKKTSSKAEIKRLGSEFKAASQAIRAEASQQVAVAGARLSAVAGEQNAKVSEVAAAGKKALRDERIAAVEYQWVKAKDVTLSTVHGAQNVGRTLTKAFKEGYDQPNELKLPKKLAERQPKKEDGPSAPAL